MNPKLELAEDVRFTCSRCGDCCRTWNVMLGPGEQTRLDGLDWKGRADELVGARTVVRVKQPGMPGRSRLRRRPDGACIYLGENDQCLVHEHFGADAKPLLCRLYPFGFYPIGDRVGVDVSFSCRAVAEGQGKLIGERVPEWAKLLEASAEDASRDKRKHHLKPGAALPPDLVWEIEHYLLSFLAEPSLSLVDRIRCVLQFVKIGTTGDPTASTAKQLREAMAKGIPIQVARRPLEARMDRTQRAIFYQWLFLCLNPPPFDLQDWTEKDQQSEKSRRLKAGQVYLKQKGRPWVDNGELAVTFKEIDGVGVDLNGERKLAAPLESFLKAKILGQKFLVVGERELPLVEATLKFFLTVPMTLWAAKALAAERGAGQVGEADVRRALRLVDRTLGTLPTSALPRKQAEACDFVMLETELVEAAICDLTRDGASSARVL